VHCAIGKAAYKTAVLGTILQSQRAASGPTLSLLIRNGRLYMRQLTALLVALLMASCTAVAHSRPAGCYSRSACKAECDKAKREIRKIQAQMRQGYSASQGEKMEAKLRDLRKLRSRVCR
jgi:hypothetical protein